MSKKSLTVGEVSELLGVTKTTLRNWDKSGKLKPQRDPENGYRIYSIDDVNSVVEDSGVMYIPFQNQNAVQEFKELDIKSIRSLIRRMSAAFRNSSGGSLMERFEEITKLMFTKLYDEKFNTTSKSAFSELSIESYDYLSQVYKNAVSKFDNLLLNGRGDLGEDRKAIIDIAKILSEVNLSSAKGDIKGIAYEELVRNTFEKSENQQFFTPRQIVEFMLELVEPDSNHTICDPASGSGGFLTEALKYNVNSKNVYGMEVDKRMAWVAQMNLEINEGVGARVYYLEGDGSLGFDTDLDKKVPKGGFDLIVTNPPFGSDFTNKVTLSRFDLGKGRSNRRRGVLFIERCVKWIKKGNGRLAIIIDDSVLNGSANEDVRSFILENCQIEAVISLPEAAFKPYASVETSILLLRRKSNRNEDSFDRVFFAKSENVGRKANGDPQFKRNENGELVLNNDLELILRDFRKFKKGSNFESELSFVCEKNEFKSNLSLSNRLDFLYHHPSRSKADNLLHRSIFPIKRLKELVVRRNESLVPNLLDPLNTWRYVGLANIESQTGNYDVIEVFGNQVKSSVGRFCKGEIVFSKLRPELRKVFVSWDDEDAYVSSECFVFKVLNEGIVNPEYLAFILRSDIVYGQIVYQISGTGRPRINYGAIQNLKIPIPPLEIQKEIIEKQRNAHKSYLDHIEKSHQELVKAQNIIQSMDLDLKRSICQDPS